MIDPARLPEAAVDASFGVVGPTRLALAAFLDALLADDEAMDRLYESFPSDIDSRADWRPCMRAALTAAVQVPR